MPTRDPKHSMRVECRSLDPHNEAAYDGPTERVVLTAPNGAAIEVYWDDRDNGFRVSAQRGAGGRMEHTLSICPDAANVVHVFVGRVGR